jgi:hypothetical protein
MNHWMWLLSLVGILSTAVVLGTDMFFLTIGRSALRLASPSAGTEIMGFFHLFADARMPIWGVSAILSNLLLVVLSRSGQRWFYLASLLMLILFVILYNLLSKPINRIQTEAAKTGERLDNGRELQASWDRVLLIRVPLLVVSLLAQCLVLLVASAEMRLVRSPLKSQEPSEAWTVLFERNAGCRIRRFCVCGFRVTYAATKQASVLAS